MKNYRVWKYPLSWADEQMIAVPADSKILSARIQNGTPCLWVKVNTKNIQEECRTIYIHGTGHRVNPSAGEFIDTIETANGLIFHLFRSIHDKDTP